MRAGSGMSAAEGGMTPVESGMSAVEGGMAPAESGRARRRAA